MISYDMTIYYIGEMTQLRQKVVCNRELGIAALRLGLHHMILHSSAALTTNINQYIDILHVLYHISSMSYQYHIISYRHIHNISISRPRVICGNSNDFDE